MAEYLGTSNNDVIEMTGEEANVWLGVKSSFQGNDTIIANAKKNDISLIRDGAGKDLVVHGSGFDVISEFQINNDRIAINAANAPNFARLRWLMDAWNNINFGGDNRIWFWGEDTNFVWNLTSSNFVFYQNGASGADSLVGNVDADSIAGFGGNDTIQLGAGNDTGLGGDGDDSIDGGAGDDVLDGGYNRDTINGGAGADTIVQGLYWDHESLDGGAGVDTVDYGRLDDFASGARALMGDRGIDASLAAGRIKKFQGYYDGVFDIVSNIENVVGTNLRDTLIGDAGANLLDGAAGADLVSAGAGNDTVYGGAGSDSIEGGAGADSIYGGAGDDTVLYGSSRDTVYGGDGNDVIDDAFGVTPWYVTGWSESRYLDGGKGNDTIWSDGGADTLIGGDGSDFISAGYGSDTVEGGAGGDRLDGGGDYDIVSYAGSSAAVSINLSNQNASGGDASGDVLSGFEGVIGSAWNDTLLDGANAGRLEGGAGDDLILFGDGKDTVYGGDGNDMIDAAFGVHFFNHSNLLDGGRGNDTIFADDGSDTLIGGNGDDRLHGEYGADRFVFEGSCGRDTIADFVSGTDKLQISKSLIADWATLLKFSSFDSANNGLRVQGASMYDSILLSGVAKDGLKQSDVIFV